MSGSKDTNTVILANNVNVNQRPDCDLSVLLSNVEKFGSDGNIKVVFSHVERIFVDSLHSSIILENTVKV